MVLRRSVSSLALLVLGAFGASAQGLYVPSPVPDDTAPRPSYRQRLNEFPPPGGRLGGGIMEYALTGGRPVPVAPQYAPTVMPNLVHRPYATPYDRPADYGGVAAGPPTAYGEPVAYSGPAVDYHAERSSLPHGHLPPFRDGGADIMSVPPTEPTASLLPPADAFGDAYGYGSPTYGSADQGYGSSVNDPGAGLLGGLSALFTPATAGPAAAIPPAVDSVARQPDPAFARQLVAYQGHERPGTIVIDTPNKYLYLVQASGQALRYGIGVGRPGFTWAGVKAVSRKAEWPGWTPPQEMLKRRPDLPRHMVGGEGNPLGARALYLGSSMYRIHGTNEPWTIGANVSSGCIRMMNEDVIDLYGRVPVGARVVVL